MLNFCIWSGDPTPQGTSRQLVLSFILVYPSKGIDRLSRGAMSYFILYLIYLCCSYSGTGLEPVCLVGGRTKNWCKDEHWLRTSPGPSLAEKGLLMSGVSLYVQNSHQIPACVSQWGWVSRGKMVGHGKQLVGLWVGPHFLWTVTQPSWQDRLLGCCQGTASCSYAGPWRGCYNVLANWPGISNL